ncbi:MAG TPA: hypothetical protein PK453_28330 [Leptospiraceae bacterium]|nr:hypothetical protein [Leptospiraceae bacterium]HNF17599.1 hypothetical protein [Leptospiraceae bacterium]
MKKSVYLLALFSVINLYSYEGDGAGSIMTECKTVGEKVVYSSTQTKITFYGDSRMDFVNSPGYGNSTMPSILNEPYGNSGAYSADSLFSEESIQNLGKEGYRSYEIVRHLDNCIPNMSKNYKIAKRFVFHVGGNNFMDSLAASWYAVNHLPKTAYGRSILPAVLMGR